MDFSSQPAWKVCLDHLHIKRHFWKQSVSVDLHLITTKPKEKWRIHSFPLGGCTLILKSFSSWISILGHQRVFKDQKTINRPRTWLLREITIPELAHILTNMNFAISSAGPSLASPAFAKWCLNYLCAGLTAKLLVQLLGSSSFPFYLWNQPEGKTFPNQSRKGVTQDPAIAKLLPLHSFWL